MAGTENLPQVAKDGIFYQHPMGHLEMKTLLANDLKI
jgi:hypothetical protein